MEKSKPCPFCGFDGNHEIVIDEMSVNPFYVMCGSCGARGPDEETEKDAIFSWNYRKQES